MGLTRVHAGLCTCARPQRTRMHQVCMLAQHTMVWHTPDQLVPYSPAPSPSNKLNARGYRETPLVKVTQYASEQT